MPFPNIFRKGSRKETSKKCPESGNLKTYTENDVVQDTSDKISSEKTDISEKNCVLETCNERLECEASTENVQQLTMQDTSNLKESTSEVAFAAHSGEKSQVSSQIHDSNTVDIKKNQEQVQKETDAIKCQSEEERDEERKASIKFENNQQSETLFHETSKNLTVEEVSSTCENNNLQTINKTETLEILDFCSLPKNTRSCNEELKTIQCANEDLVNNNISSVDLLENKESQTFKSTETESQTDNADFKSANTEIKIQAEVCSENLDNKLTVSEESTIISQAVDKLIKEVEEEIKKESLSSLAVETSCEEVAGTFSLSNKCVKEQEELNSELENSQSESETEINEPDKNKIQRAEESCLINSDEEVKLDINEKDCINATKCKHDKNVSSETKPNQQINLETKNALNESLSNLSAHANDTNIKSSTVDIILIQPEDSMKNGNNNDENQLSQTEKHYDMLSDSDDLGDNLPELPNKTENPNTVWKVGYLQVKLPAKSRGRGKFKVWQQRWVVIQPDEFVNDPENPYLMINVYSSESGTARRHSALFWRSVSGKKALVYRSKSRSHKFNFTITDDTDAVVHLAADSESVTQEWIAAIRAILWPPNPVLQLEKVLNGSEFEISIIDNDFSYHAGLLGTYGYLAVTAKKLILSHPQTGHVIQEWYLNTIDKFQLAPQLKEEDANKVLIMHTSSESSTGYGQIQFYCIEAIELLRSIASTIHNVLQFHSKEHGGEYQRELAELAEWLTPQPSPSEQQNPDSEDYYKVPKRQVRSLLDIPNFLFDHPHRPVSMNNAQQPNTSETPTLTSSTTSVSTFSQDSGISVALPPDDFLNCSITSFTIGSGRSRSSDSESSESYTPPVTPVQERRQLPQEQIVQSETS